MLVGLAEVAILSQYLVPSRAVNAATARRYQHGAAGPWQAVTLIALVSGVVCCSRETTTK